jgi:O-antigen ligase
MSQYDTLNKNHNEVNMLFILFCIWSFILVCRPQDYFSPLAYIRPSLSFGILTFILYFINSSRSIKITDYSQFRLFTYLIIVMIFGVPFSYYRSASLKAVFDYASIALIFFFLFFQLVNSSKKLISILFMNCLGVAIYGIFILKSGKISIEGRIAFGNMFDPNDIAYFLINFISFNLLFIPKYNGGVKRLIAVFNIVISLIVILKTGSRGGVIALLSVIIFSLFSKSITIQLSIIKKVIIILIAISSLQFVTMSSDRYKTLLDMKDDYNVTDQEGRIALWETGLRIIQTHPLTGVGMNRINEGIGRDYYERGLPTAKWMTIHNSLLQIGAETGVFGLFLFCFMSFNVFRITSHIIVKSCSEELIKIAEMTRVGFLGHFVSSMFLSQAYSFYWIFYISLSTVLIHLLNNELILDPNNELLLETRS